MLENRTKLDIEEARPPHTPFIQRNLYYRATTVYIVHVALEVEDEKTRVREGLITQVCGVSFFIGAGGQRILGAALLLL